MLRYGKLSSGNDAVGLEISDLMMALVAVFLLGAVIANDTVRKSKGEYSFDKHQVDRLLENKLGDVIVDAQAELLTDGIIRFRGNFGNAKSNLSEGAKERLNKLCPQLIGFVKSNINLISKVEFSGHSSEGWENKEITTPYFGNQRLSNARATNVMRYCLGDNFEKSETELMLKKFIAVGYSFSRPLMFTSGQPDWENSKRVDITIFARGLHDD